MTSPTDADIDALAALARWDDATERATRIETRRDFVSLKTRFMQAAADIAGPIGERLLHEVRRSTQSEELWRIRAPILCSLPGDDERSDQHRHHLERDIDRFADWLPAAARATEAAVSVAG